MAQFFAVRIVCFCLLAFHGTGLAQESAPTNPAPSAQATTPTGGPDALFASGIQDYKSGKYLESAEKFKAAYQLQRDNKSVLLNWGLSAFQGGQKGMALAAWRRALAIDPDFTPARQALMFAAKSMHLNSDFSEQSGWDRLRTKVLALVSLFQLLALTACFLLPAGWLLLRYAGRRREATANETSYPPFPQVGALLGLLFVASLTLTGLKVIELMIPRGTIIVANLQVRSGPTEGGSSLFDIPEGSEVILKQTKNGWTQIHNPGGMSGWVQESSLFQTSGLLLW